MFVKFLLITFAWPACGVRPGNAGEDRAAYKEKSICEHHDGITSAGEYQNELDAEVVYGIERKINATNKVVLFKNEIRERLSMVELPGLTYLKMKNAFRWKAKARNYLSNDMTMAWYQTLHGNTQQVMVQGSAIDKQDSEKNYDPRLMVASWFATLYNNMPYYVKEVLGKENSSQWLSELATRMIDVVFVGTDGHSSVWEMLRFDAKACDKLLDYLDVIVYVLYRASAELSFQALDAEDSTVSEEVTLQHERFQALVLSESSLLPLHQTEGARQSCQEYFAAIDEAGHTRWEQGVLTAVLGLVDVFPREYLVRRYEQKIKQAELLVSLATKGLRVAHGILDDMTHIPLTEDGAIQAYKEAVVIAGRRQNEGVIAHLSRSELEEWTVFRKMLEGNSATLSQFCSIAGQCIFVTGKCLTRDAMNAEYKQKEERTFKRFWDSLRRPSPWRDCAPDRMLVLGRDGLLHTIVSGERIYAAQFIGYSDLAHVSHAIYKKEADASDKNRVFIVHDTRTLQKRAVWPANSNIADGFVQISKLDNWHSLKVDNVLSFKVDDTTKQNMLEKVFRFQEFANVDDAGQTAAALATFLKAKNAVCNKTPEDLALLA